MAQRKLTVYPMRFTVEGRGQFPVDMLRYDACWPDSSEDVFALTVERGDIEEFTTTRKIHLRKWATSAKELPTKGRWASFGWRVTDAGRM